MLTYAAYMLSLNELRMLTYAVVQRAAYAGVCHNELRMLTYAGAHLRVLVREALNELQRMLTYAAAYADVC